MSLFSEVFSFILREAASSSQKKVTQINTSGANQYVDNSRTNKQIVNNGNASQDDDFWYIAAIGLVLLIACSPGIWLASAVHYFKLLSPKQCWGISVVGSGILFFLLKSRSDTTRSAFLKYALICFISFLSVGLGYLFLHYPMPVRVTMKMLGMEKDIPIEFRTSDPELSIQGDEIVLSGSNTNLLVGRWKSNQSYLIFEKSGRLKVDWLEQGRSHTFGKWNLADGVIHFEIGETQYEINKFTEEEFSYKNSDTDDFYTAKKK